MLLDVVVSHRQVAWHLLKAATRLGEPGNVLETRKTR